ncbi:MAG: DUF167 domain-containing protein [Phycisphaerae bacterium]|nr:DUF167 domain-containing protein [Phycisphaerae bacterium]
MGEVTPVIELRQQGGDVLLPVKVVPKASRDRIVGELDGALKIAVSAPPEKGAANKAVCTLVARTLGIRAQQVNVDSGHGSPRKSLRITGVTAADVARLFTSE